MTQRETIDAIIPASARDMTKYESDKRWDGQASPLPDGRRARTVDTRARLLAACRDLMMRGDYRPSMPDIVNAAGRSSRTGFDHFDNIDALRLEALSDGAVREAILDHVCGPLAVPEVTKWLILKAIVIGKAQ
jgi:AcrR family transcriptional regulator